MEKTMSIHIAAKDGEIASTVLIAGDPLRAKWVADTFLEDVICYNTVRNMLGYTGMTSDGQRISVQGSGMGMPSLSIYVNELIKFYEVKRIIRIGSAGTLRADLPVRSVVLAMGACSDSAMNTRRFEGMSFAPVADWELLHRAYEIAQDMQINVRVGNIFATDMFYDSPAWQTFAEYGVCAIETATAELYTLAARAGVQALSILSISDNLLNLSDALSSEERATTFTEMVKIALKV